MNLNIRPNSVHMTFVLNPQVTQITTLVKADTYPDRKRSILTTNSTTAVGTT